MGDAHPGEDVRILQNDLNAVAALPSQKSGFALLEADGVFGPKTGARVQEFQALNELAADGVAGPKTLGSLSSPFAAGAWPAAAASDAWHPGASPSQRRDPYLFGRPPYGKAVPRSGGKTYSMSGAKTYKGSGAGGGSGSGSGGGTKNW